MDPMTGTVLVMIAGIVLVVVLVFLLFLFWKSRPFVTGDVFMASRWSRGRSAALFRRRAVSSH